MPRLFRVSGSSLDAIKAEVFATYGPLARVVSAEQVTTGGIGRFLTTHHVEAVVRVPDGGVVPAGQPDRMHAFDDRGDLVALLADAGRSEASPGNHLPDVSTASAAFEATLSDLSLGEPEADLPPSAPSPASDGPARSMPPASG